MDRRDKYLKMIWDISVAADNLRELEAIYQRLPLMQNRIKMINAYDKYDKLLAKFKSLFGWSEEIEATIEQSTKLAQVSKGTYELMS